jgi:hypothetical protein
MAPPRKWKLCGRPPSAAACRSSSTSAATHTSWTHTTSACTPPPLKWAASAAIRCRRFADTSQRPHTLRVNTLSSKGCCPVIRLCPAAFSLHRGGLRVVYLT